MNLSIKKFLPRTLFGRSLLILITPILLIQIVATFIFFDRHWDKVTSRLAFAVAGEIAFVADEVEKTPSQNNSFENIAARIARNLDLLLSYEEGTKIESPAQVLNKSIVVSALDAAMDAQVRRPHYIKSDPREKWIEIGVELKNGVLHVSLPQRRLFSSSGYIFLLWMIGTSLALLAIAILFMRNQIRPIRRLAIVAERFGRGLDIPASFKPEGAREIRQAASAFIEMHERIRRQVQQRTAMLAGVSHDLRTPITRMKLQLAMMDNSADVDAIKSDIADMERMIGAYLDFARGEGGEQAEHTDLKVVLERLVTNLRRQDVKVDLNCEDDLFLLLRPVAFERCLNNILGNARKYASHIMIAVENKNGEVVIAVDDNGPGIPPQQYEDVFKPFFRGEPSRNPATGGVGLGLPIAQDIVHSHGGKINLNKSTLLGGLRVIITMPS